jgi:hypothetical protein
MDTPDDAKHKLQFLKASKDFSFRAGTASLRVAVDGDDIVGVVTSSKELRNHTSMSPDF